MMANIEVLAPVVSAVLAELALLWVVGRAYWQKTTAASRREALVKLIDAAALRGWLWSASGVALLCCALGIGFAIAFDGTLGLKSLTWTLLGNMSRKGLAVFFCVLFSAAAGWRIGRAVGCNVGKSRFERRVCASGSFIAVVLMVVALAPLATPGTGADAASSILTQVEFCLLAFAAFLFDGYRHGLPRA